MHAHTHAQHTDTHTNVCAQTHTHSQSHTHTHRVLKTSSGHFLHSSPLVLVTSSHLIFKHTHTHLPHPPTYTHTHTHTRTHKHTDYTKLNLHNFKQAANRDLRWKNVAAVQFWVCSTGWSTSVGLTCHVGETEGGRCRVPLWAVGLAVHQNPAVVQLFHEASCR